MKLFITILLSLAAAVGLGLLAIEDPGYVVLSRDPYVIRMPLLLFVLIVFVAFMLMYLLFNFIAGLVRAPANYRKWRKQANERSAGKHSMQGFAGLVEGNWSKAEYELLKKLDHNQTPLMNYLGAAYAAHQQGHFERRNRYLNDALVAYPKQHLAINLTRSRMLIQSGEFAEARICLEGERTASPKNVPLLRLLAGVYRSLEDWNALVSLAPTLKRLKAYPEEELVEREMQAYSGLLSSDALFQGHQGGHEGKWKSLPASVKKSPATVMAYASHLVKVGDHKEAETALRRALNRNYDSSLINLYGKVESPFVPYQIQLAESCLKKHGDDPELTLALARLYRMDDQLDKAREWFTNALEANPSAETLADLASLCEQMGDSEAALSFYRKSVELAAPETRSPVREGELMALDHQPDAAPREVIPATQEPI